MIEYISKAQAIAQTIFEIESLGIEVGKPLERQIKNDYVCKSNTDVIEVIRCKNCKHYDTESNTCKILDANGYQPDDYCSYGERK